MTKLAELYRNCHQELECLYKSRQIPFIDVSITTQLKHDGAIDYNGLYAGITPKGDDMYETKYYLQLAKKEENTEKELELKERESVIHQIATEQSIEQTKINRISLIYQRLTLVFSAIAAIGTIIGLIRCHT